MKEQSEIIYDLADHCILYLATTKTTMMMMMMMMMIVMLMNDDDDADDDADDNDDDDDDDNVVQRVLLPHQSSSYLLCPDSVAICRDPVSSTRKVDTFHFSMSEKLKVKLRNSKLGSTKQ